MNKNAKTSITASDFKQVISQQCTTLRNPKSESKSKKLTSKPNIKNNGKYERRINHDGQESFANPTRDNVMENSRSLTDEMPPDATDTLQNLPNSLPSYDDKNSENDDDDRIR